MKKPLNTKRGSNKKLIYLSEESHMNKRIQGDILV